jgi:hypothetical protein
MHVLTSRDRKPPLWSNVASDKTVLFGIYDTRNSKSFKCKLPKRSSQFIRTNTALYPGLHDDLSLYDTNHPVDTLHTFRRTTIHSNTLLPPPPPRSITARLRTHHHTHNAFFSPHPILPTLNILQLARRNHQTHALRSTAVHHIHLP